MTSTSPQRLLPLEGRQINRFSNFIAGPNAHVVAALQELLDSSGGCLYLHGGRGTGKTHLLNAACHQTREQAGNAFYIALAGLPESASASVAGPDDATLVCIDDIHEVVGNACWEKALFHCFNQLRARQGRLLVSGDQALGRIDFSLPDLRSRLGWGVRMKLESLPDADKARVLHQQAEALGIALPEEVERYLLSRGPRNLATLVDSLEAVREAALAGKRRITLPLVRDVLARSAD